MRLLPLALHHLARIGNTTQRLPPLKATSALIWLLSAFCAQSVAIDIDDSCDSIVLVIVLKRRSFPAPPSHNPMSFASPPNIGGVQLQPQQSRIYPYQPAADPALPPIPPKNEKELTREALIQILDYFSQLVTQHFGGRAIRLVVHGGACMLLHDGLYALSMQQHQMSPQLPGRTTTRDVDYIHRSFVGEMASLGMPDAAARLSECIKGTARAFGLGLDWMNSDADIALPHAFDPSGKPYDPIYMSSIRTNNIDLHTVYTAPNKILTLISVTPFWAVSLKLVRYVKWDPGDICLLLRNGVVLSGTNWTPEQLESWLYTECWAMGYEHFDAVKKQQMRDRIVHAINQLKIWNEAVGVDDHRSRNRAREREKGKEVDKEPTLPPSMAWAGRTVSAQDAMGGGEAIESALSSGWTSAVGEWPNPAVKPPPPYQNGWNIMDWANGKWSPPGEGAGSGSGSDRERRKRNKSVARTPSPSRMRMSSRSNSRHREEIFIPESDDDNSEWVHVNNPEEPNRGRNPLPPVIPGQAQPHPQWTYLNPNHAPSTKRPSSRQRSPDPYHGIYAPPDRGSKATGYGLDNLHQLANASLKMYEYGRPGHIRNQSQPLGSLNHGHHSTASPSHDAAGAQRYAHVKKTKKKEKEKRRTKAIERARSSKWAPIFNGSPEAAGGGSDTDVSEDATDESSDEEDGGGHRLRDGRRGEGDRAGQRHDGQSWQLYNNSGNTVAAGALQVPSYLHHPGSRQGSRNPSPNPSSKPKRRPPPLDLPPPPVVPPTAHPNPPVVGHSRPNAGRQVDAVPALRGPAQRAQFQFEQQQKDYQKQLSQQGHKRTVTQVAEDVARHIAAQQQAYARSHTMQAQQIHGSHGGPLRGAASWAQPQSSVNHQQSWYHQQQQQHQRQTNRFRPSANEIYN